jgi:hypothetical protein
MDENLVWFDFSKTFSLISCTHQLEEHAFIAYPKLTQFLWSCDLVGPKHTLPICWRLGIKGGSHDECPNALEAPSWGHAKWSSNKQKEHPTQSHRTCANNTCTHLTNRYAPILVCSMWTYQQLNNAMDVVKKRMTSLRNVNRLWNIPLTSLSNHLNGRTRTWDQSMCY